MGQILQNHYVLAVHDIKVSAAFYVDKLGFAIVMEPEGWIFVKRDNVMIMLGECPDEVPAHDLGNHSYFAYLRVDDADALYTELAARGVEFAHPIASKPWGMREFGITTVDGHRLMIGHTLGD